MGLININATFIFVAVNLIVLYLIMRWLLFKPVTKFMEDRAKSIKDSLENAERNKAEAAELKLSYESRIREAKVEADRIINDAKARAGREYDSIMDAAKQDAENVLVKAREEIGREKAQMVKEVKNQVAALALIAASKVIEANMDTESNRVLVNKFINDTGAA